MLNKKIADWLKEFDKAHKTFDSFCGENTVADAIRGIIKSEGETYALSEEDIAEKIAFDFFGKYPDNESSWGTYYGPVSVLRNDAGQVVEYPSLMGVTANVLQYWEGRSKSTQNPLLASRYADLVIDFSPKILKKNADHGLFKTVIDANIAICEKGLAEPLDCKSKIKRALNLSLQISDQARVQIVKNSIISLEARIAEDYKAGLWGFAFNWLILEYSTKVALTTEEKSGLLDILEKRLARVKENPWSAEHAVSLLAEYYAREKDEDNLMRVLGVLEVARKQNAHEGADALLRIHAFKQTQEIYCKYQDKGFPRAKEAFDRISREIGNLNLDWKKSLKPITVTTEIKKEDIEQFLADIFGKEQNNSLETVIAIIAVRFLPRQAQLKVQFDETTRKHPLKFLITTQIVSGEGIPVAKLASLREDYSQHFQSHARMHVQLNAIFLSIALDEFKKRFTVKELAEYFGKSAVLENEDKDYLLRALTSYWDNDYLAASHFLIPLIESSVRELIRLCGGIVLRPNDLNGYDRLTLTQLLKSQGDIIEGVFSELGPDMLFYLRLVLTEKLGMNLRNNFAHGLEKKTFFSREASDRLFHAFMCFSFIKESKHE